MYGNLVRCHHQKPPTLRTQSHEWAIRNSGLMLCRPTALQTPHLLQTAILLPTTLLFGTVLHLLAAVLHHTTLHLSTTTHVLAASLIQTALLLFPLVLFIHTTLLSAPFIIHLNRPNGE
jgi:hypothetical protein